MGRFSCITIPLYKPFKELTAEEKISMQQCFKVLRNHPIFFVGPSNLDYTNYINEALEFKIEVSIKKFPQKYFNDINGYNRLLISKNFYEEFKLYKYILIYQPDAFVFRDELEHWCSMDYDYIGAPWFQHFVLGNNSNDFLGVGNGGFSLRKVQSHLRVLKTFKYIIPPKELIATFKKRKTFGTFLMLVKNLTIHNNTFHIFNNFPNQEDFFWGLNIPERFKWFKVPKAETALKFSMEVNPSMLFRINNNQLPFGCHAWEKYEPEFWEPFIYKELNDK